MLMPYSAARSFCLEPEANAAISAVRWSEERRRLSGRGTLLEVPSMVYFAAEPERQEGPETPFMLESGPESCSNRPSTCGGVFKLASIRSTCDRV